MQEDTEFSPTAASDIEIDHRCEGEKAVRRSIGALREARIMARGATRALAIVSIPWVIVIALWHLAARLAILFPIAVVAACGGGNYEDSNDGAQIKVPSDRPLHDYCDIKVAPGKPGSCQ